jgi:hypothetical protein
MSRQSYIIAYANQIMANPEMMRKHLDKSKVCQTMDCPNDGCQDAHFIEEYKAPVCLFLEFCKNPNCKMYHPHLGSPHEYVRYIGMDNVLMTRENWELKKQRNMIHTNARQFMTDKKLLSQHLHKTRACHHGSFCKNKDKCPGAHSIEEYRFPICLFMNFCEEEKCQNFHPHQDDKNKFVKNFQQILKKNEEKNKTHYDIQDIKNIQYIQYIQDNASLCINNTRNPLAIPNKVNNQKRNTRFCSFVKENSSCSRTDCKFAHSLEDLVISQPYSTLQQKKELVEKMTGNSVSEVFLKSSLHNSDYLKMMKDQVDMIEEMKEEKKECKEDTENKYNDSEDEIIVQIDCAKISDLGKWDLVDGELWGDIDD